MKYSFKGYMTDSDAVAHIRHIFGKSGQHGGAYTTHDTPVDVVPRPEGAPEGFPVGSLVTTGRSTVARTVLTPVFHDGEFGWKQQVTMPHNDSSFAAPVHGMAAHVEREERRVEERRDGLRRKHLLRRRSRRDKRSSE